MLVANSLRASEVSVEDFFELDWFEVEFFVFERSEVMEHNTTEILTQHRPWRLPLNIVAQVPGQEGYESYYHLDPPTRLCLTYPTWRERIVPDDGQPGQEEIARDEVLRGEDERLPDQEEIYAIMARHVSDILSVELQNDLSLPDAVDQNEDDGLSNEAVPENFPLLPADPLVELTSAVADFEAALVAMSNRWLPADAHLLEREADIVERRGIGRILHHGKWLQAVPSRDAPEPFFIQAGEKFAETRELEGTVSVTLGRYLHFHAALLYRAPNLGLLPIDIFLREDGGTAQSIPDLEDTFSYLLLDESRRMRSDEIHYLDHPKFGIVVRIDPVTIPQSLLEAFENLEEEEPQ
jgi:hypothetical protein